MKNFEQIAIEEALRSELGNLASFSEYGREHRTPMSFVLEEVERQLNYPFSVYWVEGGHPEVFCLTGFKPCPVVFSTRYLSISAFIRNLLVNPFDKDILVEVTERTALKLIAEMALRYGDSDFAVLAFIKSITNKGVWLDDEDQHTVLEYEIINEAYMSTWFFGLVHELGHLKSYDLDQSSDGWMFSDDWILETIKTILHDFNAYPDSTKQVVIEKARQQNSSSVIGIDNLRSEGIADIFAISIIFKTTIEIMLETNNEKFEVVKFIQEMIIFLNIITIIERCRQVASSASLEKVDYEMVLEGLVLHPVSAAVRGAMLRQYLHFAITQYIFGVDPTDKEFEEIDKLIGSINDHVAETINIIDSGIAHAMEFSFFPERRENDWTLLEDFRVYLQDSDDTYLPISETQRFIELADSLEVNSKLLNVLKSIVDDPQKALVPDPTGDLVYSLPWVEGSNGINRPFGLDTKYGHLVFVFHSQNDLYNTFFKCSAESLSSDFKLKHAAVCVPRKEQLESEVAANMPSGRSFIIIVEDTEMFSQYMKELGDDTIWDK